MYCVNCGSKQNVEDKFCASCGASKGLNPSEIDMGSSNEEVLISSKDRAEILRNSRSVREEYESRIDEGLDYSKVLLNKKAAKSDKLKFEVALGQKAIIRLLGYHQAIDSGKVASPTDICFAEDSVLFISKPGWMNDIGSLALIGDELQYITVDRLISSSKVGNYKRSESFWRIHFVTKWADLDKKSFKQGRLSDADSKAYKEAVADFSVFETRFKGENGEFTFYVSAGQTEHHQKKTEEMILEKLDVLACFHDVYLKERIVSWNRNIGLMFGAGFWKELGD